MIKKESKMTNKKQQVNVSLDKAELEVLEQLKERIKGNGSQVMRLALIEFSELLKRSDWRVVEVAK